MMARPSAGLKAAIILAMAAGPTAGMSPRQTIAPSTSLGRVAIPALSDVDKPSAKFGLCTNVMLRLVRTASTSSLELPVTQMIGRAGLSMMASIVRAIIGTPLIGINSLFAPMREDLPAARTMAAIFAARGGVEGAMS